MSYCVVPLCTSTRKSTPGKRFFSFPRDDRWKSWVKAIRRSPYDLSRKSQLYICDDHFDLENDIENYVRFKYHPKQKVYFKKGIVPHKFDCQADRRLTSSHMSDGISFPRKTVWQEEIEGILEHESVENFTAAESVSGMDIFTLETEAAETLQLLSKKSLPVLIQDRTTQCYMKPESRSKPVQCELLPQPAPHPPESELNTMETNTQSLINSLLQEVTVTVEKAKG